MLINRRKLQLNEPARQAMRRAGQFNAQLMDYIRPHVKAGITTQEIDRLVKTFIPVWEEFNNPEWRSNISMAIASS